MTHPGSWQARTERRYEGKYGHTERASELGRSKYDQQESNPAHIPINFVNVKDVSRDRERAGPFPTPRVFAHLHSSQLENL